MSLEPLLQRVRQAEQAVEVREQRTRMQWRQFKATWRAGWTPGRIVVAGLITGFAAGRARPLRLAGDGGLLPLLRMLAPLLAGLQAGLNTAGEADAQAGNHADAADAPAAGAPTAQPPSASDDGMPMPP